MADIKSLIEDLVTLADRSDVGLSAYDLVLELESGEYDIDPRWYQTDELDTIDRADELFLQYDPSLPYSEILDEMDLLAEDANE
jgi:hypothetical protein